MLRRVRPRSQAKAAISPPLSLGVVDQLFEAATLRRGQAGVFHLESAAIAPWAEPPKNVSSRWRKADRRAASGASVGK